MKLLTNVFDLQQYYVNDKQEKTEVVEKPVEVKEVENQKEAASEEAEAVVEKTVEETTPVAPVVAQESSEVTPPVEESTLEPSSETVVDENSGEQVAAEEKPEIKVTFI